MEITVKYRVPMFALLLALLLAALLTAPAHATTFTAQVQAVTGDIPPNFLRLTLKNCGGFIPHVSGAKVTGGKVDAKGQPYFDVTPDATGAVSITVQDQSTITCGISTNVAYYNVAIMTGGYQVVGANDYDITGSSFALATATPKAVAPIPPALIATGPAGPAGATYTLPAAGPSAIGGVMSKDCSALGSNYMLQKINTDGSETCVAVSSSGAVTSIFGRTGAVTAQTGDYTPTQVGLGNVANVAQIPLSYLDTDGTGAANSDTRVMSQKAVETYVGAHASGGAVSSFNSRTGAVAPIAADYAGITTTAWQMGPNPATLTSSMFIFGPAPLPFAWSIPANGVNALGTSQFYLDTLPTASWVGTFYKVPAGGVGCGGSTTGTMSSIGTVTISTAGSQTWSVTATNFAAGDCFIVVAPSVVDTTAAGPALSLVVVK